MQFPESPLVFLEGSWLLVLSYRSPASQLLVFSTLLPQHNTRSWRILDLPPHLYHVDHSIFTRYENSLGECPEFSVDSAQRIFTLYSTQKLALVTPVIRSMHSVRATPYVPRDKWEDIITIHLEPYTMALQAPILRCEGTGTARVIPSGWVGC